MASLLAEVRNCEAIKEEDSHKCFSTTATETQIQLYEKDSLPNTEEQAAGDDRFIANVGIEGASISRTDGFSQLKEYNTTMEEVVNTLEEDKIIGEDRNRNGQPGDLLVLESYNNDSQTDQTPGLAIETERDESVRNLSNSNAYTSTNSNNANNSESTQCDGEESRRRYNGMEAHCIEATTIGFHPKAGYRKKELIVVISMFFVVAVPFFTYWYFFMFHS